MPQRADRKMVRSWAEELEAVGERLSAHFARSEVPQRAQDYLRGLLSSTERKNSWQLAEVAGNATPYGIQHLLGGANWDADEVRDDLREYVIEHLGDDGAVLIVDETGFIKKGKGSVGVKRHYTGTAGKTENCQVGVFLSYASRRGQAFIDRELYLPEEWAHDQERRKRTGVPEEIEMRTKPELAREMLRRALDAGVQAAWVVADSVYGDTRRVGMFLEEREQPYVLALSGKAHVWAGFYQHRVSTVLESLRQGDSALEEARGGWRRLSAGDGSKGPRLYDWLKLPLNPPLKKDSRGGFWCAVPSKIRTNSPPTRSSLPKVVRSKSWRRWPAADGGWRSASRRPKGRWDSHTTKSVAGAVGTGTSPSRSSPTPSSPPFGPKG